MSKKIDMQRGLVIAIVLLYTHTLFSQTNCTLLLNKANTAYTEGKYETVVNLLENNINSCNFEKIELEQARKLLASAYAVLGETNLSENLVLNLLKNNPTYQAQSTIDPQPFVETLQKFERSPRIKIGFGLGQYQPLVEPVKNYSVLNTEGYSSEYTSQSSIALSIYAQYILNKNFALTIEPTYSQISFSETLNYNNMASLNYGESSSYYKLPLYLNYTVYKNKNFTADINTGIYGSFTGETQSNFKYQIPNNGEFDVKGLDNLQRTKYNLGYQLGFHLEYSKNRYGVIAQAIYGKDFNMYNTENGNSNSIMLTDYYYSSDDILMNHLNFNIGISYTLSFKIKHKYRSK